ncbi:MAG: class I SAM-dependent methyltransferase [Candidatus Paceibacterota bacterium]
MPEKDYFIKWYGGRNWDRYRDLVAGCIKYGAPGKWLDVGCGTGYFVECAGKFGIDCVGIDGSADAVNIAKARCSSLDIRQHFLENKLPFEDDSMSTIMCNQVIEHLSLEAADHMLSECHRILKPHGVIFINSPCKYNTRERYSDETHINLYTPGSLKMKLEKAGFRTVASLNSPMKILGTNRISKNIIYLLFKLFPIDHLSASANCIAVKDK